jgi:uncharacterized protein YndB with AHSA1/START domain
MRTLVSFAVIALASLTLSCSTTRTLPAEHLSKEPGRAVKVETDDFTAYTVSIDIAAPPQKVWALLVDVNAWSTWNTTIVRASGTVAPGEKVTLVSKLDPEREFALTVAELETEKKLVWEDGMPMGLFSGVRTYTLDATDAGTRFTMSEVFSGGMAGMITDSIPDMRPSFETFAKDLQKAAQGS